VEALNTELKHSHSLQLQNSAKTAIPEMKLHHTFAGTTAVSVTGRNNLLSPAPTDNRKTNAADISGGTSAPQPLAASSSMTGLVNNIS
jgi:hypothetical protein